MPISIGQKLESDFRNPLGLLSDCHRRIERFDDAGSSHYLGRGNSRKTVFEVLRIFIPAQPPAPVASQN